MGKVYGIFPMWQFLQQRKKEVQIYIGFKRWLIIPTCTRLKSEERFEDGERGVSPEVDFCLCHLVFLSMSPDKHKRHGRARGVFG